MSLTMVTLTNLSNTQAYASSIITTVYYAFELNFFASIGACQIQIRNSLFNFIFAFKKRSNLQTLCERIKISRYARDQSQYRYQK